eukprot:gene7410-13166_t
MLNNGKHLLWSHIAQSYHKDRELGLHKLVKIGPEHINISPFERFMQNVLEEYFGYQRSHGRRCDKPMASEFGYNDQIINMQQTIAPKGNVRCKHSLKWSRVSDEPLLTKQIKK